MKHLLILLLSFSFIISSFSQEQFNVSDAPAVNPVSRNVFTSDSGYYLVGARAINNKGFVTAYKYDLLGNFLWYKSYGDSIYSWVDGFENNCIETTQGFALAGDCSAWDSLHTYIRLYHFDENFDTLWTKTYLHDSLQVFSYATTYCSDGGFAIAGLTYRDAATGEVLPRVKALLLRTDSLGNYLWHKTYGTEDYKDTFYKVVQTPDGGFLCGGGTNSFSSSHNTDWFLVKTDSWGNEEWNRTYGNTNYVDSRIAGILNTTDTNYVITGAIGVNSNEMKPYIKVLNKDFELITTKTLPYQSNGAYIGQIKEIDNGYIGIGGDRINTYSLIQTTLTKFDVDFDEIWHRKYTVGDTTNTENYILSVDTCPDGGYILGGWATHPSPELALIKTDSFGCDGTDWWPCNTDVMVKPYVHSDGFKLYPNPTNHFVVIESSTSTSSASERLKVESLAIYDISGKIIKSIAINESSEDFRLDVSSLESGIYLVKLGQRVEKLVVE